MGRSLAERLTRRVEFSVGGQPWPLIFTHRALFLCEELTGVDMLSANLAKPSAVLVRALLFAAVSTAGSPCTPEDVGKSINRVGIASARRTLVDAWMASMADPDKDKEPDEDAPKPTWMEIWAIARQELKLSDEEWLDMTPRQFSALQKLQLEQFQREELLVCKVEAAVINFSMRASDKWISPQSLMLHKLPDPPELPIGDKIMKEMSKFKGLKLA